ncbi:MAG: ComF family protein [Myxococcales bacterium]|nr:ComF family protein [Myxococcales bacterium]
MLTRDLREVRALWRYVGPIRDIITGAKFRNDLWRIRRMAPELSAGLAGLVGGNEGVALVPIPSHPMHLRRRGFDLPMLLARWVAKITGQPVVVGLKNCATSEHQSQIGVGRRARWSGRMDTLRAVGGNGRSAILIDDVLTTGATVCAAAEQLSRSGWSVVGACVLARTPHNDPEDLG